MTRLIPFLFPLLYFTACSDDPPPAPPNPTEPDTSSHDFLWTTYYLGDAQSHLQDVFAISDSDVWAVGEIYLRVSTGQLDLNMYNAAHWDGTSWTLHRVHWTFQGQQGVARLNAVCGFSNRDVWVAPSPKHWNGSKWTSYTVTGIMTGSTIKIWGTSTNNLFFVGTNGSITHFDGSSFTRMESGTTTDLYDISGTFNGKVYACGGEFSGTVLEYDGNSWKRVDSLSDTRIGRWSIFAENDFFAVGGHDLRFIDMKYGDTLRTPPRTVSEGGLGNGRPIVTTSIRGSSRRNVFAVGGWQYVIHYNGKSWKWYDELWDLAGSTQYSVSVTENSVFIVGYKDGKATILHGVRKK